MPHCCRGFVFLFLDFIIPQIPVARALAAAQWHIWAQINDPLELHGYEYLTAAADRIRWGYKLSSSQLISGGDDK